jgi:hypothetical protein
MDKKLNEEKNKLINQINIFTKKWVNHYFGEYDYEYGNDYYWIGENVGEILSIGDFFFNLDNMIDAVNHDINIDDLIDWYWQWIDTKKTGKINLKSWKYATKKGTKIKTS